MPLRARFGISSFDTLLDFCSAQYPQAGYVLVAHDEARHSVEVVGLLDDDCGCLSIGATVLGHLSALLANPMPAAAVALVHPEVERNLAGQRVLTLDVDEPAWALALEDTADRLRAGSKVPTEELSDVLWAAFQAGGFAVRSIVMERTSMSTSDPGDLLWSPLSVSPWLEGTKNTKPWANVVDSYPGERFHPAAEVLLNELAGCPRNIASLDTLVRNVELQQTVVNLK